MNREDNEDILKKLRQSVNKGTPYGTEDWVSAMVDVHKLSSTLRGAGRPKGSKNK